MTSIKLALWSSSNFGENIKCLKKIIVITISFLMLLGTFKDVVVYLSFKVHQDYISNYLCIEKDIPKNTCKGKCQLKESISENHQKEQDSTIPFFTENKQQLVFMIFDVEQNSDFDLFFIKKLTPPSSIRMIGSNYISKIFHPPKV